MFIEQRFRHSFQCETVMKLRAGCPTHKYEKNKDVKLKFRRLPNITHKRICFGRQI